MPNRVHADAVSSDSPDSMATTRLRPASRDPAAPARVSALLVRSSRPAVPACSGSADRPIECSISCSAASSSTAPPNASRRAGPASPRGAASIPNPPEVFSVTEKSTAGFGMANLKGNNWKANVGLRIVRTDQTSTGNVVGGAGEISNAFGDFTHVSAERTYWDYLPSATLTRDIRPDLVLRVAAARTMARPDFTDVSPRVTLNPGALSGQGGDPNVDPFRANQADVSLEWYHGKDEILSGAVFYKDIRSFITDRPVLQNYLIQTNTPNLARCTPAFTTEFPNRYSCQFTINQRSNGGGGNVKGLEVAALQKLGHGFGVQANYTYSDAKADEKGLEIPGNSKHSGNVVAFFENQRLGARLAYSYRSEFFVAFDRSTRLNQAALKSLDASLAINLYQGLALTLDGVNLTNEKIVQFAGDTFRPRAVYDNGRYYFVGFRFQQ